MSEKKSTGVMFAPFNIIAMKDIKDKKTQKPGLRPLFDCVDSIQAAVDDIRLYLEGGPDSSETELVQGFLKQLTDMQVRLLEVSKSRVQSQNLSPVTPTEATTEAPVLKEAPAELAVETPKAQTPASK